MTTTTLDLCKSLMEADTEAEVVAILSDAGYWGNTAAWRYFDDNDNNYSSIGNQQSEAVAALIEKIVNSEDARLMNACAAAGIDPRSEAAPRSIREAVARFFEARDDPDLDVDGRIGRWTDEQATAEGRLLTVAATGNMPKSGKPSLSIADQGEGQEPDAFPDTFLSLQRNNKLRVHFVQGKFNMGGTGALRFCSPTHRLQLIVSRRNPQLVPRGSEARSAEWGFTVVRREPPGPNDRSSVFTYLAPVDLGAARRGRVLSFAADTWPIFPEADDVLKDAYARPAPYGTLVKLYEYQLATSSNIVSSGGGLLRRINVGLPELALPVRLYECRPGYRGHKGSFQTNALGIGARLDRDKMSNLEAGFPAGGIVNLDGHAIRVRIYAFQPGKASDYRTARQGVVFSVNGQAHANFSLDFFRRKSVGMSYLADSLIVLVDCSSIEGEMREDLFMNSRDRLGDTPLAIRLERELESLLSDDSDLRTLRNSRREAELAERLSDSKPLSDVLQDLINMTPSLAQILLPGIRVTSPFPGGAGRGGEAREFRGKTYPTYFRAKGRRQGDVVRRDAHDKSTVRLAFETDAENGYFDRDLDPGSLHLFRHVDGGEVVELENWRLRGPRDGVAGLTLLSLPSDAVVGDVVRLATKVADPSQIEPFSTEFELRIVKEGSHSGAPDGERSRNLNRGKGRAGGSAMLQLPRIKEVERDEWSHYGFDESSALKVVSAGKAADDESVDVYDFFVNVDNVHLKAYQKASRDDAKLVRAKFVNSLVLLGMAQLRADQEMQPTEDANGPARLDIEAEVLRTSAAVAPVLLPLLEAMGSLKVDI